jgi:MYXO-CTERM domain-containing protein
MKTNTFLTGCLLAAAGIGCGGVTGIPIEKTSKDFAAAICPKAYDCCTADQLMGNKDLAGTTEAECESNTAQHFRDELQARQDAENAGRSKYDQAQVDACLGAIRAATCETLTGIRSLAGLPACDSTFVTPLVPSGGKCQNDFECIGGVCQKPDGSFDGVCVAGNAAGAACAGSNRCGQDLICDGRGTSMDATDDVCVAPQDNGATCVDGFDCKSRNCVADANGAKTCQAVTTAQCFYGGGCAAGGGRPSTGALILMGLFVVVALARTRRQRAK